MVVYHNKTFINTLKAIFIVLLVSTIANFLSQKYYVTSSGIISGIVLYGLWKKYDWVIGAIRVVGGLAVIRSVQLAFELYPGSSDAMSFVFISVLVLSIFVFGVVYLVLTPRYIKVIENNSIKKNTANTSAP